MLTGSGIAARRVSGQYEFTERGLVLLPAEASFAQMTAAVAELDALPVVRKGSFVARMIPGTARV